MIEAGKLDRRIVIQSETIARDDFGGEDPTWSTLATVWAGIEYRSGTETNEADQMVSMNKIMFTIRYRTDITARMRIYYNSVYYYITLVEQLGRQEGTVLHCELRDRD